MFVYFGFTACPDVCPTELTKMTKALYSLPKEVLEYVQPIFITCDPARDSCEAIEKYLKDYHPKFIGLTGTPEQIRHCSKKYRVYYSGPIKEYSISDKKKIIRLTIASLNTLWIQMEGWLNFLVELQQKKKLFPG
jgi:cytochrome oxidase Cu insertion factor (SCO1/SenC/PrrC family)